MKSPLLIEGMRGMGDSIHQRGPLRQIMQTREVYLETSWPSAYHDLVGPDLHLIHKPVALRTQTKNAARERMKFWAGPVPRGMERMRVGYNGPQVMHCPSKTVLEGMCRVTGTDYATADYRLPVPSEWGKSLDEKIGPQPLDKPWLVYRPLCDRTEYRGAGIRNANAQCYTHLFAFLREHFHVFSVADLHPGKEDLVGPVLKADVTFHNGELTFEELAALFKATDLVFTSSGYPAILAPAVETPCINIVGGYEEPSTHDSGARFAPFLSIGPRDPCRCWTSGCMQRCLKDIDMVPAIDKIAAFMQEHFAINILPRRGEVSDMFETESASSGPAPLAAPFGAPARNTPAFYAALQNSRLRAMNPGQGQKA